MPDLSAERFPDFFRALWGQDRDPFAWQKELASRVLGNLENPWPEAIALPTASGKTACLDIAVYALAAQASPRDSNQSRTAPRRIFFVVDRRVIVDEAYERARSLADKLRTAEDGILWEVGEQLRKLGCTDIPLACFQLRGGMYRSDSWARSPLQPTIVASTVDQLGSRLLFRAYGRSFKAWPIQAGLAGNDSLVLLDEAHCAVPFLETLQAVRKYRNWAEEPLRTPFHITIMSATPPPGVTDVFRDTSYEPRMPGHPLGARQMASKPTSLIPPIKVSGSQAFDKLAKQLAKTAEMLADGQPVAVIVFANRVATVRLTHRILAEKHGDRAILLTGRMRPFDKDDTVREHLERLSATRSTARKLDAPVFVTATQTLEVGANLDFDLLVTECASLDALRQRFGRLNRMGRKIAVLAARQVNSVAAILIRADQAANSDEDPVYGAALWRTWNWLKSQADDDGTVDMGIASLEKRLPAGEELLQLNAPTTHAPVMLPAHLDCWVQTAPEPVPTPDISVFLHGPERASADVQVCWRADLDLDASEEKALDILALCPPAVGECLPVPIWFMRRWLAGDSPPVEGMSDVEGVGEKEAETPGLKQLKSARRVVRWRGRDEAQVISDEKILRPGDVIVIPSSLGGWDVLGDLPRKDGITPVLDWGDRAYAAARAKALLRLHPSVIAEWPDFKSKPALIEFANQAKILFEADPDALLASLRGVLESVAEDDAMPFSLVWLKHIAGHLLQDRQLRRGVILHPSGEGVIVRSMRRLPEQVDDADSFSDEDDPVASGTVEVSLASHLEGVAEFAGRFASGCGLPAELTEAAVSAGLLHDPGKADPRFQALLRGGNPLATGELLAKSGDIPQGRSAYRRACKMAGYPPGGRHELLSVRLAESAPELLPKNEQLRDLVLHLVASHHGHCRPFAPVVNDEEPVQIRLEWKERLLCHSSDTRMGRIDSGVAERFWRLTRRHGWWGLAFLEAILRLSDHRRSEWEEANS